MPNLGSKSNSLLWVPDTERYKAEVDYRNRSSAQTTASSIESLLRGYEQLGRRHQEERAAQVASVDEVHRRASEAVSAVRTSAADAGVSGQSVAALMNEARSDELRATTQIVQQRQFRERQLFEEAQAMRARSYQEILGGLGRPVGAPDYLGSLKDLSGLAALF